MTEWIDRAQKCLITILTVLHHLSGEITRIKFSFGAVCQSPIELTLSYGVCLLCKISWVPFALALAREEPTQPLTHQFTELTLESFWVFHRSSKHLWTRLQFTRGKREPRVLVSFLPVLGFPCLPHRPSIPPKKQKATQSSHWNNNNNATPSSCHHHQRQAASQAALATLMNSISTYNNYPMWRIANHLASAALSAASQKCQKGKIAQLQSSSLEVALLRRHLVRWSFPISLRVHDIMIPSLMRP